MAVTDLSTPDLKTYASLLLAAQKWNNAETLFELLQSRDPKDPEVLKALTLLSLGKAKPEEQERRWTLWSQAAPEDPDLSDIHAQIQMAAGDVKAAQATWKASAETQDPRALVSLAKLARQRKDYAGALLLADKAVAAGPKDDQAWAERARVNDALKHPLKARADWDTAIALAPQDPWHRLDRGQLALRELYDLKTAQGDLEFATIKLPENVLAWESLAEVYERKSEDHDAWHAWLTALALRPDYAPAYPSAAMLSFHFQDYSHAAQYARLAAKAYPAEYGFPLVEGLSLLAQGQRDQALSVLQKASGRFRDTPSVAEFFHFLLVPNSDYYLNTALQQEKNAALRVSLRSYQGAYYTLLKQAASAKAALDEVAQSGLKQLPEAASASYWLDNGK